MKLLYKETPSQSFAIDYDFIIGFLIRWEDTHHLGDKNITFMAPKVHAQEVVLQNIKKLLDN